MKKANDTRYDTHQKENPAISGAFVLRTGFEPVLPG